MSRIFLFIARLWATSRGRLVLISLGAFVLYCVTSYFVAQCLFANKCYISMDHPNSQKISASKDNSKTNQDSDQNSTQLPNPKYLEENAPSAPQYDSYIASIFDTAIFFVIVSFAIGIYGFSRPEDENFERKLTYLFPDLNNTKEGKDYFLKKINKMAAISPFSRHTVSFDEFYPVDDNYNLFKCGAIYEAQISNMHGNTEYKDDSVKLKFALDQLKLDEIKAVTGDSKWGQLTMVRTSHDNELVDPLKWHNGVNRNFIDTSLVVSLKELVIPPKEKISIDVHSWSWSKLGKEKYDFFTVQRFTEKLEIFFINNLPDLKVVVSFEVMDNDEITESVKENPEDFSNYLELEVAGHVDSRKSHTVINFTPEKVVLWKARLLPLTKVENDSMC